jgi:UPF0271 protein
MTPLPHVHAVPRIDLNIDLGEDPAHLERDTALAACATSLNIASGGHAGDEDSMRHFVALGRTLGIAVGAHPSYPDRAGFGRKPCTLPPDQLRVSLASQIRALAQLMHPHLPAHIKPHGRLYHDCAHDASSARILIDAACDALELQPALLPPLVGAAGSSSLTFWRQMGVRARAEAFIDRAYMADGSLVPRSMPESLLTHASVCCQRALDLAFHRPIPALDGSALSLSADTLCLHSDTPAALTIARAVRHTLLDAGVILAPPSR